MADQTDRNPVRSGADKEKSRQQSRSISGKDAAKGNKPSTASTKGGGQRPAKSGPGGRPPRRPTGPAPTAGVRPGATPLLVWGVVGLVLVLIAVLVIVKLTSSPSTTNNAAPSQPLSTKIAQELAHVPASVFDKVGVSSPSGETISPPNVVHGQPTLMLNGKPGVFYMGAEYCPYCAAERWAMIVAFSRFGTFTGLKTMQSSSNDVFPSTQTFTLVTATYTSKYVSFTTKEIQSNVETPTGKTHEPLQSLTQSETALQKKYDTQTYTGVAGTGGIPFVDFGNLAFLSGASYSPAILQGVSRTTIAGTLTNPNDAVTQSIIATSNYLSASVCAVDHQKPASVCSSKGVTTAAKAMKLSS